MSADLEIPPQVVERGRSAAPYRARKAPEAVEVHLCGHGRGILVLRCHDLDVATVVAFGAWLDAGQPLTGDAWTTFLSGEKPGVRVWVRWVLDDYSDPAAGGSWERELRGTVGATPAVLFAEEVTS